MPDQTFIHGHMPGSRETRCGIYVYIYDETVILDDSTATCPDCRAGLHRDMVDRIKTLEELVSKLSERLEDLQYQLKPSRG